MKRVFAALIFAAVSSSALAAADPRTVPTQLPPAWQAKTRELFKQAIEIPSVHNRGETPRMAKLLADQFRAAGIPDADIHIMPYEALPGDQTAALIVRWRSPHARIPARNSLSRKSGRFWSITAACVTGRRNRRGACN